MSSPTPPQGLMSDISNSLGGHIDSQNVQTKSFFFSESHLQPTTLNKEQGMERVSFVEGFFVQSLTY